MTSREHRQQEMTELLGSLRPFFAERAQLAEVLCSSKMTVERWAAAQSAPSFAALRPARYVAACCRAARARSPQRDLAQLGDDVASVLAGDFAQVTDQLLAEAFTLPGGLEEIVSRRWKLSLRPDQIAEQALNAANARAAADAAPG